METAKNARYYEWALVQCVDDRVFDPRITVQWGWRYTKDGDIEGEGWGMPSDIVSEVLPFTNDDERHQAGSTGTVRVTRGKGPHARELVVWDPSTGEWWSTGIRQL